MKVSYDGHDLLQVLEVIEGFTPYSGASFQPVALNRPQDTGGDFVYTEISAKQLPMPFIMQGNLKVKYDKLMTWLNVREPKVLSFGAMEDRVFWAIPTGDLQFTEKDFQGTGVINWLIVDGVGHIAAVDRQAFTLLSPGILQAKLVNNGSDWASVTYEITHGGENGYLGISSEYGAMEFGSITEADTVPATKSVLLTSNNNGNFANWRQMENTDVFYENPNKRIVTKMTSDAQYGGRYGILPASFTQPSGTVEFYGAASEFVLPTASKELYNWSRLWVETGATDQTGNITVALIAEDNTMIAAMAITKKTLTNNTATILFFIGDGKGGKKLVQTINFQPNYWKKYNPYGSESRVAGLNPFDLRREGSSVVFYYNGRYFKQPLDSVTAAKKTKRYQYFVGQVKGRPASKMLSHHYINDFALYQQNVPYMKDVPNRFAPGSVMLIDGDEEKPYYSGMQRLGDEVFGSEYFKIPPGETTVQIAFSDFASPIPTAYAKVNEVFI